MKVITRITTQQKNKSRYNIFLGGDGEDYYAFSVDESVLIEFHLRKGLELNDEEIEKIKQKDELQKFYTRAIHYLSYRMRSRKEIYDYLEKNEVQQPFIEEIIRRLENEKLINDREFAEMFVRSRINTSTKGPRMIQNELKEKGISALIAQEALKQFTYEAQYEKTYKFIMKKLKGKTKHSFRKRLDQMKASLMQRGFSQDVIQAATAEFIDEKDEDEEWEALVYQGEKLLRKYEPKLEGYELEHKLKEGLYRRGFSFDQIQHFIDEKLKEE